MEHCDIVKHHETTDSKRLLRVSRWPRLNAMTLLQDILSIFQHTFDRVPLMCDLISEGFSSGGLFEAPVWSQAPLTSLDACSASFDLQPLAVVGLHTHTRTVYLHMHQLYIYLLGTCKTIYIYMFLYIYTYIYIYVKREHDPPCQ